MVRRPSGSRLKRELVRLAHECATDPGQLPVFLGKYTAAVHADGSGLVVQDLANHSGSVHESHGFDPFWENKYAEHYASTNIWIQRAGGGLQPGVVHGSELAVTDNELMRTEFYNDFLRPQRLFHSFGAAVTREHEVTAFITSVRSRGAGFFTASEHEVCVAVMPHLQAALRIRHVLAGLEAHVRQLSATLDHLAQGIVITDAANRILFTNRSAEGTLRAHDGLWIAADGLRAARSEDTLRLRQVLKQAASTVTGNGTSAGGAMRIARPGKPPLSVSISPLAASICGSTRHPAAILLIAAPPARSAVPDPRLLGQLFGLTPAEARLTSALVSGRTVKEFAEDAGVTLNTARTHLKSIFAKTGVSRQSALVRDVVTAVEQLRLYL